MGSIGPEPRKGVEQDDLVMPVCEARVEMSDSYCYTSEQVIKFSDFLHGTPTQKQQTAAQVSHAFKTSGFLYLSDHGIPDAQIASAFSYSAKFFARSQEQKDALRWTTPDANRGYVESGREKVTTLTDPNEVAKLRASAPDMKETIEIGREGVEGHPNQWPDKFDDQGKEFTEFMKTFFLTLKDLHINVMRAIAVGMLGGLDAENFFDTYTDKGDNNLRLLHYPAVKKSVFRANPNQVRAGEHSDYGSITLLFQDNVGGLEVKSPKGTWVRAKPIPGTIVVNAGDLLMRWSNDTIVSTKHRVIQPPPKPEDIEADEDGEIPARYSIAYFCNPNFDRFIEALPGTVEKDQVRKYEGINSGEYL